MNTADYEFFRRNGYVALGQLFSDQDAARLRQGFDEDRATWGRAFWRPLESAYQTVNCDPLITWPAVEEIIRHPPILDAVEALLGAPICLSEACLRHMAPYEGEGWRRWHRDRPHWQQHPLRTQYVHALVYLADVDETTHCFSLSPEAADAPILDQEDQLARGGIIDLHGPAGTVVLFNLSVLHTATIRPTQRERKSVQIYYGRRDQPHLSNYTTLPARLWRDHSDPEVRAFYSVLNPKSRAFAAAFGASAPE
ncbi:MAG: phytanoyl-CoA dioxygenase family protein [Gemmatimonadetes bacterium]|nr:phytanoyl-CoA dioxygenase family protein [Gemmatimonadota bacterium]MXW80005.1 phytanoyl-CoA dioxygenase family protein [Gemmatimonadota bacterium]MYC73793.1 phytanoyl-CoA dioxygenase family protein [Gemmatimonadota bacterium]MYI61325.1 phytanoyl-CoA dioxygenase family protein [Gemmatimonadota bacterium]